MQRAQEGADGPTAAPFRLRRSSPLQRSEHVFTLSQSFAHFLRHANGRPHASQILLGRSALRRIFGMPISLDYGDSVGLHPLRETR